MSTTPDDSFPTLQVTVANYQNPQHAQHILALLDIYARDPMGGAEPLADFVKHNVVEALATLPYAISILCYVDDCPAGLLNSFESFSTFKCKPLINIHDIIVAPEFRGMGISQMLLSKIEDIAQAKGCCKLTLEVLQGNEPAQHAYRKFGFSGYQLDPQMGHALFWQKNL
jgi:ribosomal protein S18 acetylase RimI-like enzyme